MKETEVINISGNFVIYSSLLPYLVSDLSHYLTAGLFYFLVHVICCSMTHCVFLDNTFCAVFYWHNFNFFVVTVIISNNFIYRGHKCQFCLSLLQTDVTFIFKYIYFGGLFAVKGLFQQKRQEMGRQRDGDMTCSKVSGFDLLQPLYMRCLLYPLS